MAIDDDNQQVEFLGPRGLIKKDELTRVIIQCLFSLGYENSATLLESESKVSYISPQFDRLRTQVLIGDWAQCFQILVEMKGDINYEGTRASVVSLILEQCIREHLSRNDVSSALAAIQQDFSAFAVRKEKIHHLGFNFFVTENYTVELNAPSSVIIEEMRKILVAKLKMVLLPPITVPERTLEYLVEMNFYGQILSCQYHNKLGGVCLYENHFCGKDDFPTKTLQILRGHENEVWFVQFSNNGEYLASSSSDCTCIIWKVPERGNLTLEHTLVGHQNPVSYVSWSPSDTMLLTCGHEEVLKLWDIETGICKCTFNHAPVLSSCTWLSDTKLVFGNAGPDRYIYRFKIDVDMLTRWQRSTKRKITHLAVTPDGNSFICIYMEEGIAIWNHKEHTTRFISEQEPTTSFSVSRDSQYLLVNLIGGGIRLWHVSNDRIYPSEYWGHKQTRFVINSCFGGSDSRFIASGSEDSQVYIWSWWRGSYPIEVLSGHSMAVNCVSWNPKWPHMLASASDDRTIRIWGPSGIIENNP